MKTKTSVQRHATLAKGGSGGSKTMFSKQVASPDRPGNTGKDLRADSSKSAKGGTTKLGYTTAVPAKPGTTGSTVGRGKGR